MRPYRLQNLSAFPFCCAECGLQSSSPGAWDPDSAVLRIKKKQKKTIQKKNLKYLRLDFQSDEYVV
jgi:hypothetical protein